MAMLAPIQTTAVPSHRPNNTPAAKESAEPGTKSVTARPYAAAYATGAQIPKPSTRTWRAFIRSPTGSAATSRPNARRQQEMVAHLMPLAHWSRTCLVSLRPSLRETAKTEPWPARGAAQWRE